jgi:hypothetical protein
MQLLRAIASTAAQIDNARRIIERDLCHKILGRARALAGKLQIKIWIPLGHVLKPLPLMTLIAIKQLATAQLALLKHVNCHSERSEESAFFWRLEKADSSLRSE